MAKVIQFPQRPGPQEKPESKERYARRKDGLFQVELSYKDELGRQKRKVFYGKTQGEAKKKRADFQRDLEAGLKPDDRTAFSAYADHWLKTYKADVKPGTRATYRHDVDLMKDFFGDKKLREITGSDVQAWINTRCGLSASAIHKSAMTARAVFEAARQDRLILFNPCDKLTPPSGSSGTHRALEPWERDFLTHHCQDHRFYFAAMLMLYAGLRRGEVMALRYDRDVDLPQQLIHVREAAHIAEKGTDYFIDGPKSAASVRDIPIFPPLDSILAKAPKSGLVLLSAAGKPMTESAFSRCLESYHVQLDQALNGVSRRWASEEQLAAWRHLDFRCHDLRHTFCTLLYEANVDPKTAQAWMGHADIMVTMRIYTHLSQARQGASVAAARAHFAAIASTQPAASGLPASSSTPQPDAPKLPSNQQPAASQPDASQPAAPEPAAPPQSCGQTPAPSAAAEPSAPPTESQ